LTIIVNCVILIVERKRNKQQNKEREKKMTLTKEEVEVKEKDLKEKAVDFMVQENLLDDLLEEANEKQREYENQGYLKDQIKIIISTNDLPVIWFDKHRNPCEMSDIFVIATVTENVHNTQKVCSARVHGAIKTKEMNLKETNEKYFKFLKEIAITREEIYNMNKLIDKNDSSG